MFTEKEAFSEDMLPCLMRTSYKKFISETEKLSSTFWCASRAKSGIGFCVLSVCDLQAYIRSLT